MSLGFCLFSSFSFFVECFRCLFSLAHDDDDSPLSLYPSPSPSPSSLAYTHVHVHTAPSDFISALYNFKNACTLLNSHGRSTFAHPRSCGWYFLPLFLDIHSPDSLLPLVTMEKVAQPVIAGLACSIIPTPCWAFIGAGFISGHGRD